jgi:glycosyltransferase involved in cell wall biosynthesis
MIRVLYVEASSGGVVGGSLTGLYHLIRGLDRRRFVPAMVLYEPKTIEAELAEIDVPVFYTRRRRLPKEHALQRYDGYHRARKHRGVHSGMRMLRGVLRVAVEELPSALRLARIIRRFQADVVHLGNGIRATFDGILACLLTGTPCVCHVKGFEKYSDRERRVAPRLASIVCMTEAVRQHCEASGIHNPRTTVVYDALDEAGFRPQRSAGAVRAELGITDTAPCAGVVGNIQEWKGQLVFVEAMARVHAAVPSARGLIIGGVHRAGSEYHERLQNRLRELRLTDVVRITGFRTDIADVMNALDVVVHSSVRAEPFGRVILEGMLLGKPVVATAAGGVPELIADGATGYLTAPGDAAQLAERLLPLLQDAPQRCQLGERARAWARDRFSLERHVASMSEIYSNLSKGK